MFDFVYLGILFWLVTLTMGIVWGRKSKRRRRAEKAALLKARMDAWYLREETLNKVENIAGQLADIVEDGDNSVEGMRYKERFAIEHLKAIRETVAELREPRPESSK
jgi:hypothetical protein